MVEFNPPIKNRDTDELIIIANGTIEDWQQELIEQAKAELISRNISASVQQYRLKEFERESNQAIAEELQRRSEEEYTLFEKVFMVLFWFKYLFRDWSLGKEGYKTKQQQRVKLLALGFFLYALLFLWEYLSQ